MLPFGRLIDVRLHVVLRAVAFGFDLSTRFLPVLLRIAVGRWIVFSDLVCPCPNTGFEFVSHIAFPF